MTTQGMTGLGLTIIPDFITEQEEADILSTINPSAARKQKKERNSIKRYGSSLPYPNYMVSDKIPERLNRLSEKFIQAGLMTEICNHVSINEYFEGQAVKPHIDSPESGETITVLSLKSHATMKFEKGDESFLVELPPRSLVQMKGEIRYRWLHSILPVAALRYSIVFRNSKKHD